MTATATEKCARTRTKTRIGHPPYGPMCWSLADTERGQHPALPIVRSWMIISGSHHDHDRSGAGSRSVAAP